MKTNLIPAACLLFTLLFSTSCSKNIKNSDVSHSSQLQIRLTDSPNPEIKEVWIDIQQVEIIMGDSSRPIILDGTHPGLYNLLDFTAGKDTLITDALIPPGTISQIRLILGDDNFLVTKDGEKIALKTPSAQQSGLKVQVHEQVSGGILYRITLDFDAARSIVFAGNSGNVLLKPVLRIMSFAPSGGEIKGVVIPDSIRTFVYAIQGLDTIATTSTDILTGSFLIKDIPAGNYSVNFLPSDPTFQPIIVNASVELGKVTLMDTVKLQ